MNLTFENYHSVESNRAYFSSHQWGNWITCAACQRATLTGEYEEGDKTHYAVGAMLDLCVTDPAKLPGWLNDNTEIVYLVKALKSPPPYGVEHMKKAFRDVVDMLDAIRDDEIFNSYLAGDPQRILTGEIAGHPWRCMIDIIDSDREIFTDLKTTKDLHKDEWSDKYRHKVPFYEAYEYWRQMAIYQELIRQNYEGRDFMPRLAVIHKKEPFQRQIIRMDNPERLAWELKKIEGGMEAVDMMKTGEDEGEACGRCEYCQATQATQIIDAKSEDTFETEFQPRKRERELPAAMLAILAKHAERRKQEIADDEITSD